VERSAVLIVDGSTAVTGQEKSILELNGRPLIERVVDAIGVLVDEVIIVAESQEQSSVYSELVDPDVKILVNPERDKSPLLDALKGFRIAKGKYCLLLASEFALVSPSVIDLFFDLCPGKTAVIPRWPNQQLEPLQAVYHAKTALEAGKLAFENGLFDVEAMIEYMGGIRYISTLAIQEFDPELKTFFKVKTLVDLKMAETLTKPRKRKVSKKR
jgi:molybdopterin-guanine dinucleotide biosynthesis protein A